jgi:hypothetical protein
VLRAVVDDCRGGKDIIEARSIRKAVAYLASTDRTWPFSFENLCDALGLDVTALRHELVVMRDPV